MKGTGGKEGQFKFLTNPLIILLQGLLLYSYKVSVQEQVSSTIYTNFQYCTLFPGYLSVGNSGGEVRIFFCHFTDKGVKFKSVCNVWDKSDRYVQ